MTHRKIFLCAVAFLLPLAVFAASDFPLFLDGKPAAALVMPETAGETFQKAVSFFNDELSRCTGAKLPQFSESVENLGRITFKLHDRPQTEIDAFSITFPDQNTLQIEGTELSVRWAFNHILEKHADIRWFFPPIKEWYGPEINHYPPKKEISVPRQSFSDSPAVNLYRCASWSNSIAENWNRNMLMHGVHMMSLDVFPVWKYAPMQSWPKEILPVLNGKKYLPPKPAKLPLPKNPYLAKRTYDSHFQYCWSNPASVRIAVENILEILKNDPSKRLINMDVNDNGGFCQCETCLKLVGDKRNSIGRLDYSEVYWKWVNEVATEVSKQYPNIIFRGIAYTEVLNPPSFRLHKNVLPVICMELVVMTDPKVGPLKQKMLDEWTQKAAMLGLYDYAYSERFFLLPRVYFRQHARLLKNLIKNHNLRYAYFESDGRTASCGPQQQLLYRLTWNPDLDVDEFLKQYYADCVGEKAAPYLNEYYSFWENYWTGEEIRKTQWYGSVSSAYMHLGERSTHTYALKKDDLKYVRSLIEKVVKLAEIQDQKLRAEAILRTYEYYELAAKAAFAEIIPPDGKLRNAEQAAELLRAVPEAIRALEQYQNHPMCDFASDKGKNLAASCYGSVGKVYDFIKAPIVIAELRKLAERKDLPLNLLGQLKIMLGAKPRNLIANGDLEEAELPMVPLWSDTLPGERDATHASNGKYAYKMHNGAFLVHPKIEPGKTYMFLCDVYLQNPEVEGKVNFKLGPSKGLTPRSWINKLDQIPTAGTWNTYSETVTGHPNGDSVQIQIWLRNFDRNNPVWIDNLRLYCLEDMK
ncbi:MAG: DUF4838 domain-containing protein [Victivallales bacterium]|nr:DUF4838 domain-containing protein [Victivallales bacterium]